MSDQETETLNDKAMPLMEHFIELRRRLIWCVVTFVISFAVCYHFSQQIYLFLAHPLESALRAKGQHPQMIFTDLTEAFFTNIKVAFFGATFLSFPMIATQAWIYIAPGLYKNEKKIFAPFLIATPFLFILGAALAYYFVFPMAWKFFLSFQIDGAGNQMHIELQAKVSEYLRLVTRLILAFGIAFELPVLLTLLAKVGFVTVAKLKKFRRYAYVIAFVIAAILTPPDVITQISLAVPLIILYEISIFSARLVEPKLFEENL
ncbi:twin-arginine translocase subunit TatC [Commensalibacter oyaizuii]|uniref:Sec-independent protein translocase protein TatC n=1 Tax=Commensalibacter oyaizuii TaxID=3043873 RepID=A0ABT6Q331_9PROT|nr:twin-arginine translocase subunit TatC [Commensalibacter sp. TBRC 16381]MDI2091494.1 twin-arginine translocase subunit TatC [Commensalibacter sp. TBRC 16381]